MIVLLTAVAMSVMGLPAITAAQKDRVYHALNRAEYADRDFMGTTCGYFADVPLTPFLSFYYNPTKSGGRPLTILRFSRLDREIRKTMASKPNFHQFLAALQS